MPDLGSPLEERDVIAAQTLLDAIGDVVSGQTWGRLPSGVYLELRGLMAASAHDLRAAGIAEGYRAGLVAGHQEARQAVQGALEDL